TNDGTSIMSFVRAWTSRFWYLLLLGPKFLRYCAFRLSSGRLYSDQVHDFSQIIVLSPRLRQLFGMTSLSERAYLQWFARHIFRNQGAIVELGCWLGSTTIPLAIGLAGNVKGVLSRRRMYSYDNFVWESKIDRLVAGTPLEGKFRDGESFQTEFERRIAPWRDWIIVRPCDLAVGEWHDGPIEFLVVDAMKSWQLANRIISEFYSAMIPGRSWLFHQDFAHWFTPWIHLTQFRFRQYFELEYEVPRSTSVVFRLREAIPGELTSMVYSFESFGAAEIDAAFEYSISLVSSDKHANIAAAKVMCWLHLGDVKRADRELDSCRAQNLDFSADLGIVARRVETLRSVQSF